MYDILNIEKSPGNQKFGLAGCEKMAMKETIVSKMRFGLVFDNVLWSKPLLSLVFFWVHVISHCSPPWWLIAPIAHGKAIVSSKWWMSVCLVFCKKIIWESYNAWAGCRLLNSKRALQCPSTYTTPGHCCYGIIWVKVNITKLSQITKATNSLKTNWNTACSVLPCGNSNE